jgi:thiol:disulfide interchange protein DsbG
MFGRKGLTALAGAACLAHGNALAADEGNYPPAVQALTDRGLSIENQFEAPGGLTGYTARAGGREVVFYATPDGENVVIGTMVDSQGRNLTRNHLAEHMPEPDLSSHWAKLEEANWIAVGAEDPERVVYMFTDPNCPYCNSIWQATEPYYDDGLQVRHIMVGIIKQSSLPKAAAIMSADDPAAALRRHEESYEDDGGIAAADSISTEVRQQLQANTQLMREVGVNGTPAIFYKDADGKVKSANGMPSLDRLAQIYRFPKQDPGHASLERFR